MPDYAIGDVQGCYDALQRLLERIHFNEHVDRLWFVGDLVNRGPDSLAVLRFIKQLPLKPYITLGNHDLYFLSLVFTERGQHAYDPSLTQLMQASDCLELANWLRQQKLLHWDPHLNVAMCHAGIAPMWDLAMAQTYALELETAIAGTACQQFLTHMYGNTPHRWSETLTGITRLRVLCNYLTRMRFCWADGGLEFEHQGAIESAGEGLYPWFNVPHRVVIDVDLVFGHWAALQGQCASPRLYALDTGCVWGGHLTALRLQDKRRITVPAHKI